MNTEYSQVPALNEIINHALRDVQSQLDAGYPDGDMPAMLVLAKTTPDLKGLVSLAARDVSMFHESSFTKRVLGSIMDAVFTDADSPANALVYLSEAWFVRRAVEDGANDEIVSPSEAEDRMEAFVIVARTKLTTETFVFELDKPNKTIKLASETADKISSFSGTMVGTPPPVPPGTTVH